MRFVPSMSHRLHRHSHHQQQQQPSQQQQQQQSQSQPQPQQQHYQVQDQIAHRQSHHQRLPFHRRIPVAITAGDGALDAGDRRNPTVADNGAERGEAEKRGTNVDGTAPSRAAAGPAYVSRPPPSPSPPLAAAAAAAAPTTAVASTVTSTLMSPSAETSAQPSAPARKQPKILPRRYERCDTSDLVLIISSMLMELIAFNDKLPLQEGCLTRFHSRAVPRMSLRDYLQRLTTHATLSPPLLLSMVFFIDRLCALRPNFSVTNLTVHRFLISAVTVASKGLSDSFWTNKTYAKVGGVSVAELSMLELELLFGVDWRIVPTEEELRDYYFGLVERCEDYELEQES